MRVLILGGSGLLGHKLCQILRDRFEVYATVRRDAPYYARFGLLDPARLMGEMDLRHIGDVLAVFGWSHPDVVINTVGIVKQREKSTDPLQMLEINSLLPHRLALACRAQGARLIHISTDCVFSGKDGNYCEEAISDASDLYGKTKYLGEVQGEKTLSLRTSFIGRELETRHGLMEWFLAQKGKRCCGFSRAIFSGLTTIALAEVVANLLEKQPGLCGLYHVSGDPISKYDLLCLINEIYGLGVGVDKDTNFVCDRSLDSTRFRRATGWQPAPWRHMILQMKEDPTSYDAWNKE